MSRDLVELALWELSVDRHAKQRFRADPREWLARYRLDDRETAAIVGHDVAALVGRGVNPMLTMGFWMEHVEPDLTTYREGLRARSTSQGGT